jgi:hypothetical protein
MKHIVENRILGEPYVNEFHTIMTNNNLENSNWSSKFMKTLTKVFNHIWFQKILMSKQDFINKLSQGDMSLTNKINKHAGMSKIFNSKSVL